PAPGVLAFASRPAVTLAQVSRDMTLLNRNPVAIKGPTQCFGYCSWWRSPPSACSIFG
ncbi:phytoene/squalene synthase family protein, partial [Sinorhizobium meliloti]